MHLSMQISIEEEEEEEEEEALLCIPKQVPISDCDKLVYKILNGPNEEFADNFRMDKVVFLKLCDILKRRGLLRHTNRIKIEEQVAIFLFIIGHSVRTRAVQQVLKYSGETISRHFNNVLNAIISISTDFFQPNPNVNNNALEDDPKFYPYFKDCVGVVDCIHIPLFVGVDEQGPFRNTNGLLSQNVLFATSFDLRFHYVLAGWEGSASDHQVLTAALTRPNKLFVPLGKYYLVDKMYKNIPGFLAPYNGFSREEPKALFNERHKLLHRSIDQTVGALKVRFPILLSAPPYPLQTQVKLVIAACALHNYIRSEKPEDDFVFQMFEKDTEEDKGASSAALEENQGEMLGLEHDDGFTVRPEQVEDDSFRLRDEIASNLWDHYLQHLSSF